MSSPKKNSCLKKVKIYFRISSDQTTRFFGLRDYLLSQLQEVRYAECKELLITFLNVRKLTIINLTKKSPAAA